MSCIKKLALLEPLVDTCDEEQVVSDLTDVIRVDVTETTAEALDFERPFVLKIKSDTLVHALVGCFDVDFDASHVPMCLSTSPFQDYTHWKQTVFYFERPYECKEGDSIMGTINVKRAENNKRDLDVVIKCMIGGQPGTEKEQAYKIR
jgi:protein arginine N-methyltransferase 1